MWLSSYSHEESNWVFNAFQSMGHGKWNMSLHQGKLMYKMHCRRKRWQYISLQHRGRNSRQVYKCDYNHASWRKCARGLEITRTPHSNRRLRTSQNVWAVRKTLQLWWFFSLTWPPPSSKFALPRRDVPSQTEWDRACKCMLQCDELAEIFPKHSHPTTFTHQIYHGVYIVLKILRGPRTEFANQLNSFIRV